MQGIDEKIVLFFQSIRCEVLTLFFKSFVPLEFWIAAALVLVVYYFFRTGVLRVPVVSFVLAKDLSIYCFNIAKDFFHRPRPFMTIKGAIPLTTPHSFSFPSGHATLAMASAVVLAHHFPKARKLVYTLAILVGLSRVYLGAHYLSDVLGGFLLGGFLGWAAIFLEKGIFALAKGVQLQKKSLILLLIVLAVTFNPSASQAKGGDEQDQIILLNDSAAALEDSNPELSKSLTKFADEMEKDWENNNANKDQTPVPVIIKNKAQVLEQVKLLKAAALAIEPTYPIIAKGLSKMAKDMNKTGENEN